MIYLLVVAAILVAFCLGLWVGDYKATEAWREWCKSGVCTSTHVPPR